MKNHRREYAVNIEDGGGGYLQYDGYSQRQLLSYFCCGYDRGEEGGDAQRVQRCALYNLWSEPHVIHVIIVRSRNELHRKRLLASFTDRGNGVNDVPGWLD